MLPSVTVLGAMIPSTLQALRLWEAWLTPLCIPTARWLVEQALDTR